MRTLAAATILLGLLALPAEARHHSARHHVRHVAHHHGAYQVRHVRHTRHARVRSSHTRYAAVDVSHMPRRSLDVGGIVSHPAGCPRSLFCGCGAAVEIFGAPVRALWLAANWFKFPRAAPAPGMAAVRAHHVFVIRQVLGNGRVIAYDANSGGGRTRVHEVSLRGYTVVNPRGRT